MSATHHDARLIAEALRRMRSKGGLDFFSFKGELALAELGYVVRGKDSGEPDEDGLRLALLAVCAKMDATEETIGRKGIGSAEIGRAALRLGPYKDHRLMQRRNDAAMTLGCAATTVAAHENEVLGRIAELLVEYATKPTELDEHLRDSLSALRLRYSEQPKWSRWAQSDLYVFDHNGAMTELTQTLSIRCDDERPVQTIRIWHEYLEDSRPGVVKAERADRCRLIKQDDMNGGHFTELLLEPPLSRNEPPREIGLRLSITTDKRCRPRVKNSSIAGPSAAIALQFDLKYLPTKIWWWQQVGAGQEFNPPPGQIKHLDATGYVSCRFSDIIEGQNIGLAWQWPD